VPSHHSGDAPSQPRRKTSNRPPPAHAGITASCHISKRLGFCRNSTPDIPHYPPSLGAERYILGGTIGSAKPPPGGVSKAARLNASPCGRGLWPGLVGRINSPSHRHAHLCASSRSGGKGWSEQSALAGSLDLLDWMKPLSSWTRRAEPGYVSITWLSSSIASCLKRDLAACADSSQSAPGSDPRWCRNDIGTHRAKHGVILLTIKACLTRKITRNFARLTLVLYPLFLFRYFILILWRDRSWD